MNETLSWATSNFGNVNLYDRRRTNRLINIAARLAENKGVSLAQLFDSWYDIKAVYNLLKVPVMHPDIIQSNHRELTFERMVAFQGHVLAIEDSSEFDWNGNEPIEGLGPVGSGRESDQGFILHSTLAVGVTENSTEILGLPFQQYYVRPPKREKRVKRSSSDEYIETDLWREVIKQKAIPSAEKIIRVCDRGADIYEVMTETHDYGSNYIIRLKHDRAIIDEENHIKSLVHGLSSMGEVSIEVRGRNGTERRTIVLQVNWIKTKLRAPSRPGIGIGTLSPLDVYVVHVCGVDSETSDRIEWFLYTNMAISSLKDANRIIKYYTMRWTIEDYHKAFKSGMKAENLQLESAQALFAAIAIMSIVALRLVSIREAVRGRQDSPASESGLDEFELKVLGAYLKRELKTVKCVGLAIGRLGGHQNRKGDGMPGLMTLWKGLSRLIQLVEGAKLASKLNF